MAVVRQEEALNKKKKSLDDLPDDVDDTYRNDKPLYVPLSLPLSLSTHCLLTPHPCAIDSPQACAFGGVPPKLTGTVLAVWDSVAAFRDVLKLSPVSVEQFALALTHSAPTTVLTELHMCLLELVLEDREDEDYMSDDENAMDERERYRYEVQRAPLTVGLPTLAMLNALSWPAVLHSFIVAVPRHTAYATPGFHDAVTALHTTEYPLLSVTHKLALVHFLVRRAFATERIRHVLGTHLGAAIQASKDFNRAVLQDRKVALEDEKRLREKQRAELAGLLEKTKPVASKAKSSASVDATVAADTNDDDDAVNDGAPSDAELDALAGNDEALVKSEEELERLQAEDRISRHEYLARKKSLEAQRERLRRIAEAKLRKQRLQDQMERKRAAAKKGIQDGMQSKDARLLYAAIEKGKECGLPDQIVVSATHVLEILDAEAARDEEASSRKRKYNETLRRSFVRTEPLGRDRSQCRYWRLQGDSHRLYVEKPSVAEKLKLKLKYDGVRDSGASKATETLETMEGSGESDDDAVWYCYASEAEVVALIEALDARIPREALLKTTLTEHFELITSEMPVSKPGLLISDLLNEDSASGKKRQRKGSSTVETAAHATDFLAWRNERKTWRKPLPANGGVDAVRDDLRALEAWLSKRLGELGSDWLDRTPDGHADWLERVQAGATVADLVGPLLALEAEVMALQLTAQGLAPTALDASKASAGAARGGVARSSDLNEKSDDEDDDDDDFDVLADDSGAVLWPTSHCRSRWIAEVTKAATLATLAVAVASLEQRLEVVGLSESTGEDHHGVHTRRVKSEKEKRSRKERAAKKKQQQQQQQIADDDDDVPMPTRDSTDEWDEDCYICSEGGELLCCDGCPRVFHYTCAGLRRIPRGKTFCHVCDPSVRPVFPVAKPTGTGNIVTTTTTATTTTTTTTEAQKEPTLHAGGGADVTTMTTATNTVSNGSHHVVDSSDDHIHTASGGLPQTTTRSSEDQWDVDCSVCGLGGELLCCDGCPRAFHVACIGLEVRRRRCG